MFKKYYQYIIMATSELSILSINAITNKLFSEVIEKFLSQDKFAVQLQIKVNGVFRSINKIQVVTLNEKEELKIIFAQAVHHLYSHFCLYL
jgi:hypothetical protein